MIGTPRSHRFPLTHTLAAAAVLLSGMVWSSAGFGAGERLNYTLVAVNAGPTKSGVEHTFVLTGSGSFTADSADGGGRYIHLDMASEVPKTILSSGDWKPTKVVRWVPAKDNATYAGVHPGVLDLIVDLVPDQGSTISGVKLRINCNVGFAGIVNNDPDTGEKLAEGFWISTPDGDFKPKDPILGLTAIGQ